MHLHARAVELVVDRDRRGGLRQRGLDVDGGAREHRRERAPDLEPDRVEARAPVGQRDGGDRGEVAVQHERAAHRRDGHPGGLRHRVRHHTRQRALAQLAAQDPHEEPLLVRVRAGEQRLHRRPAGGDRARPSQGAHRAERRLDLGDRQPAGGGGGGPLPQQRPADADLALGQLTRQPRHDGGDLGGAGRAQQVGERGDLRGARRRRRHGGRGGDELAQLHTQIMPSKRRSR